MISIESRRTNTSELKDLSRGSHFVPSNLILCSENAAIVPPYHEPIHADAPTNRNARLIDVKASPQVTPIVAYTLSFSSTSTSFPLLPTHRHQPIEELVSKNHRSHRVMIPQPIDNLQSIRNFSVQCPSYNKLRFPTKTTNLLQF